MIVRGKTADAFIFRERKRENQGKWFPPAARECISQSERAAAGWVSVESVDISLFFLDLHGCPDSEVYINTQIASTANYLLMGLATFPNESQNHLQDSNLRGNNDHDL